VPSSGLISGRKHALDGLRTVAVVFVFLFHAATGLVPGGSIGVDVFFTLSGFVITLLIMKEYLATGGLRLGVFYAKRLARLWPALLAVCAVVVTVGLVVPASKWAGQEGFVLPAAGYVMNLAHFGMFGGSITGEAFGPTWTLAVEEQFYLVWPLLLLVLLRFWKVRTVAWITAGLAVAFLLERLLLVLLGAPLSRLYNGPDTRADELLIGCTLALVFTLVRRGSKFHASLLSAARRAGPPSALVLLAAVFLLEEPSTPGLWFSAFWTAGPTVLALLAALAIGWLVLSPANFTARILSHPWLAGPGRDLSYAFYLWHLPVYLLLMPLVPSLWLRVPLAAALTAVLACASFRLVEKPVRSWANKRLDAAVVRPAPGPAQEREPELVSAGRAA
jgi:peptidoglycan/LPS O-acetylase OafA/YrhL